MTVTDITDTEDRTEGGLIRNGRYMIVPVEGGKPVPHTRVTNFAKTLEDTFALMSWRQRMVAIGLTHREDLRVQVAACSLEERKELNDLCEKAKDAARANAKRDTGSALHKLAERVDRGEDFAIPAPWDADIEAYRTALQLAGVTILPEHIEGVVVIPRLKLAGRFDRIVGWDGNTVIADMKTGQDLSYSWGSIAVQLALYASAETVYDPATKTHTPMPVPDQERALVFHCPSEQARCDVYQVNLSAGFEGITLIEQVNAFRRQTRTFATVLPAVPPPRPQQDEPAAGSERAVPAPTPPQPSIDIIRAYAAQRVDLVKAADFLIPLSKAWPAGVPTLKQSETHTEDELFAVIDACDQIVWEYQLPEPPPDPRRMRPDDHEDPFVGLPGNSTKAVVEGPMAPEAEVRAVKVAGKALEAGLKMRWGSIITAAKDAGTPVNIAAVGSWRRVHIARALIALVGAEGDFDTVVRACLTDACGPNDVLTTGAWVGSLTPAEAEAFYSVAARGDLTADADTA